MGVHWVGPAHGPRFIRHWNRAGVPLLTPRIEASVGALRGVLPLPLMRQALAGPGGKSTSVFKRNPGHGTTIPTLREVAVLPIPQEVQHVLRLIVGGIEEL